jgi:hypothetical protein
VEGRVGLGEGLLEEVLGVGRVARRAHRRGVQLVEQGQGLALEPGLSLGRGLGGEGDLGLRDAISSRAPTSPLPEPSTTLPDLMTRS